MLRDRVGQTSTTSGTGDYELTGLLTDHLTFASQYANGDTVTYYAQQGNMWEANEGILTIPGSGNPTLSRGRFLKSSSGSPINWPDNSQKIIKVDVPAEMFGPLGGRLVKATAGGTADAITATVAIPTPVLKDGMQVVVDIASANTTTTPTLQIISPSGALAAKTIVRPDGSAVAVGENAAMRTVYSYKAATDKWLRMALSPLSFATSLVPPGAVVPYAGTVAPTGWLFCFGQAISRTTYANLFAAIGTTYGVGDGATTFNLPDLRGRVVAGKDNMGGTSANRLTGLSGGVNGDNLGATGGAETHTLTTAEGPAHTHSIDLGGHSAGDGAVRSETTPNGIVGSTTTGSTGGGAAHNNVQPTIILNYIIKE